jgi:threonine synthase
MVKTALLDSEIQAKCAASTANSINIARLLPQVIYHGFGLVQLLQQGINKAPVITVPSGNFGNLTAAVYAAKIGLTIQHFIAATNSNAIVPHYLETGIFQPEPSRQTYSNAMDVGNPSNFERLLAAYDSDYLQIQSAITGIVISDADTVNEIRETYDSTGYILDPHTAVGVASAKRSGYLKTGPVIVTATAHPAKFPDVIQRALQQDIPVPDRLRVALDKPKQATLISADYEAFKKHLLR